MPLSLPLLLLAGLPSVAHAQETIDLGVVKESDISVVQKLLYPKDGRSEIAVHLGLMPFDTYTTTPVLHVTYGSFLSETFGWEAMVGGGYGLKNASYLELESPAYAVSPDAYRYLAEVWGGVEWVPVYAKLNLAGARVIHHDIYFLGGGGLTIEQAFLPDHAIAPSPMVGLGMGARLFLKNGMTVRFQLRDDVLFQHRVKTQSNHVKQNVALTVGIGRLSEEK